MSTFTDLEKDAASVDGFVNENGLIPTRRNGPKPSWQYLVDGWNAEIAAAILEMNKSRGFRVVGTFADGFTYELFNDVGIDADGNSWIYVGAGAPNKVVAAGTVPSVSAGYEQVTFNVLPAHNVTNANGGSVQDFIDTSKAQGIIPWHTDTTYPINGLTKGSNGRVYLALAEQYGNNPVTDGGVNWVLRSVFENQFVTPEDFGPLSSNDNQLFIDALATGKPIKAFGTQYNVSGIQHNGAADIEFGKNTVINNFQTSGVKRPSFLFYGTKDQSEIDVTVATLGALADTITVADASGFSVGDTCLLQENAPLKTEINYGQGVLFQDANYREFNTIQAINGNDITFEEYLRFPYQVANSLKLQKINFNENAHVRGGVFIGGNNSGGGVTHRLCRNSSAFMMKGRGLSELDRNGGTVSIFEECWESSRGGFDSKWTLFGLSSVRNQSCLHYDIKSKRTSNGGVINSGDRFCAYDLIVQDSTGDDNGDGIGISNGARFNTYGSIVISGSRCYGIWSHQWCDDNTFESFTSMSGITVGAYMFGDRNSFGNVKINNHPTGLVFYGNDNSVDTADVEAEGAALLMAADGQSGNRIKGKFVSTGVAANSYDLLLGNLGKDNDIQIAGGDRGVNYGSGKSANHDNTIIVDGPKPYVLKIDKHTKGYTWSNREVNVNATPRDLQVPVKGGVNGLGALDSTVSGDAAKVYRISIKTESTIADTYSEYLITNRQGAMQITPLIEGSSIFAARLSLNGTIVQIATNGSGAISMTVNVDQY